MEPELWYQMTKTIYYKLNMDIWVCVTVSLDQNAEVVKDVLQSQKYDVELVALDAESGLITLKKGEEYRMTSKTVEIIILLEGEVQVAENGTNLTIKKGDAFLVVAQSNYKISATSQAVLYKAGMP